MCVPVRSYPRLCKQIYGHLFICRGAASYALAAIPSDGEREQSAMPEKARTSAAKQARDEALAPTPRPGTNAEVILAQLTRPEGMTTQTIEAALKASTHDLLKIVR